MKIYLTNILTITIFVAMKYIAYLRVSTRQQGDSGLGLEAQRTIISHYFDIDQWFVDIKSGSNTDRKELTGALLACQDPDTILVVAKLDRLSRKVEDCLEIWKRLGGRIRFCDIPGEPDKFTITMYAAFAERERELISLRTRQALKAKRDSGWKPVFKKPRFKVWELNEGGKKTLQYNYGTEFMIKSKRNAGMTYAAIAQELNSNGEKTALGFPWSVMAVKRVYSRL